MNACNLNISSLLAKITPCMSGFHKAATARLLVALKQCQRWICHRSEATSACAIESEVDS